MLALGIGIGVSCKTTTSGGPRTAGVEKKPRIPGLPKPLKLPAQPPAAIHVANPADTLASIAAYLPGEAPDAHALLRRLAGDSELEGRLASHVDTRRGWDAAVVEGQTIVYLPINRSGLDEVARLLEGKPKVGEFGAVDLQRPAERLGLAWLDRDSATLTVADTLEGLATGRELASAYGKRPLFLTVDASQARPFMSEVPFTRVTVTGEGLHDFEMKAEGVSVDRPEMQLIADGALTGMLESPQVALGLSTKYADYDQTIRSIIARASREVSKQNFLVRGTLEDMLRRGSSVMRSWNGRVLAGVGPRRHLLLAFGTHDAKKASGATLYFVRGLLDNLSLAKSFGVTVPKLRFAKNKTTSAGIPVHVVALERARKYLPSQAAPLVDDRGDLRVAMAFPERAGGAMIVAGPDASNVLAKWLEQTGDATPAADSSADLLAATIAVRPETLAPALQDETGLAALELHPDARPTKVVVRRSGQDWNVTVKGPEHTARTGRRMRGRAAPPTRPVAGKPARTGHRGPVTKPAR